jgi:hypothetical protein
LDALEPRLLAQLVTEAVEEVRDDDLWNEAVEEEREMRQILRRYAKGYREGSIELPELDGDEDAEEDDD